MSSATITENANAQGVVDQPRDSTAIASVHETAVAEIAGMIRDKFSDEGSRNFSIGKRAFEHAQWQRGNFAGYEGSDFDNLMNRVRDDVRIHVAISPKSIKLGEWVRCHVLRELVADAKGRDAAEKLTFFEYRNLYGKALAFSKTEVQGTLVDGWLDFIMEIVSIRTAQVIRDGKPVLNVDGTPMMGRVSSEDFFSRLEKHEKALAEAARPKLSPEQEAALKAAEAAKVKVKATTKAQTDLTKLVSDSLSGEILPLPAVLGIVENVAKAHGLEIPSLASAPTTIADCDFGKATVADCDTIASGLFKAGLYAEMVHLRDVLDKMVAAVDAHRASMQIEQPEPVASGAPSKGRRKAG